MLIPEGFILYNIVDANYIYANNPAENDIQ